MGAFERQLVHTCTIQRNTPTQNSSGELIAGWENLRPGITCRYVEQEEKYVDERQGLQLARVQRLLLPAGTDVTTADQIVDIEIEDDEVLAGPFSIEEKITRRGPKGQKHISLRLEQIR